MIDSIQFSPTERFAVLVTGVPGCGKTTLARLLAHQCRATYLGASDVLSRDPRVESWQTFWRRGMNAPDDEVLPVLWQAYAQVGTLIFLDGYPRSLAQLHDLARRGGSIDLAVFLHIPLETAFQRVANRMTDRVAILDSHTHLERINREAEEIERVLRDPLTSSVLHFDSVQQSAEMIAADVQLNLRARGVM